MNEVIWSIDEDDWTYGHECIEDLFDQLESDDELNEDITVFYGERKTPSTNFVGVSDIVDLMGERAYDVGGEFAYDYPDVTPKCPEWKELEDFLTQWQAKFQPSFYTAVNVNKHVITQEDIDNWRGND